MICGALDVSQIARCHFQESCCRQELGGRHTRFPQTGRRASACKPIRRCSPLIGSTHFSPRHGKIARFSAH
jgi:hypothetical protein